MYQILINDVNVGTATTLNRAHEFILTYVKNNNSRAARWVGGVTCNNATTSGFYPRSKKMDYRIPYYIKDDNKYDGMCFSYTLSYHFWWVKNNMIYDPNLHSRNNYHQDQELSKDKIIFKIVKV